MEFTNTQVPNICSSSPTLSTRLKVMGNHCLYGCCGMVDVVVSIRWLTFPSFLHGYNDNRIDGTSENREKILSWFENRNCVYCMGNKMMKITCTLISNPFLDELLDQCENYLYISYLCA